MCQKNMSNEKYVHATKQPICIKWMKRLSEGKKNKTHKMSSLTTELHT